MIVARQGGGAHGHAHATSSTMHKCTWMHHACIRMHHVHTHTQGFLELVRSAASSSTRKNAATIDDAKLAKAEERVIKLEKEKVG